MPFALVFKIINLDVLLGFCIIKLISNKAKAWSPVGPACGCAQRTKQSVYCQTENAMSTVGEQSGTYHRSSQWNWRGDIETIAEMVPSLLQQTLKMMWVIK
ncbi:hypothetical protein L6164_010339 [Bauhinia variegata]|uniref:Uncharacterized protein n=1 Tax=Bauhinia variegata TaxID=167791 RepID=A0ACB9PMJ2_BAUVA|nr:hypothetical protein L6164_010339 [Bauhinia variegata]